MVEISHDDQTQSYLLIRWGGKTPAMISPDGRHYYYGRPHPEVYDGASQLRNLVRNLLKNQPAG